jgi:hypothetical protein
VAAHRIASSRRVAGLRQSKVADPFPGAPHPGILDALCQHDVELAEDLEWLCAFQTDALIELIQARLYEDEHSEHANIVAAVAPAVRTKRGNRLVH